MPSMVVRQFGAEAKSNKVAAFDWVNAHLRARAGAAIPCHQRTATKLPTSSAMDVERALNTFDPHVVTPLCRVMRDCGSDKGMGWHNYTTLYSELVMPLVGKPGVKVFELGIGTNDPAAPSSMGAGGTPGASLRGWARHLPDALVYAADIDRMILVNEPRIRCFYVDQRDPASVAALWFQDELAGSAFDVIIDDGLHEFDANVCFFEGSWHKLKVGGIFVIEDLMPGTYAKLAASKVDEWRADPRFAGKLRFHLLRIPNAKNTSGDNALLIAQRVA